MESEWVVGFRTLWLWLDVFDMGLWVMSGNVKYPLNCDVLGQILST